MSSCCQDKSCEVESLLKSQARTLWIVLAVNATMFGAEVVVGLLAGSLALLADSLDMLGDSLVYGFSLFVIGRSIRWRAGSALLKGVIMAVFGVGVLAQAIHRLSTGAVPDATLIGIMGSVALVANGACLYLLTRHRSDDINMRSTWLCSRNDIVANLGVIAAAVGVHLSGSMWPDLAVSLVITAVFLNSAVSVLHESWKELGGFSSSWWLFGSGEGGLCAAGTCPVDACRCSEG